MPGASALDLRMKQNESCRVGYNSEDMVTNVNTRVIAVVTDVAQLRDQDLAPSQSSERQRFKPFGLVSIRAEAFIPARTESLHRVVKTILIGDFISCLELGHEGLVQVVEDFNIVVLAKGANEEIEDYHDYVKAKFAPNTSSIGKHVVVGGYGLMLRGKVGVVTDVKSEEGRPIAVVILDDEPEIPCAFRPQDLTIEGWGEQLDIGQNSNTLEQIKGPIKSTGQTPWIGVQVGIFQSGHLLRTKIGTIRDVICGQDNPSGLRLVIILETYDPAITNKEYTVNYEHVLEVETKRPLRLHQPLLPLQSAFLPTQSFIDSRYEECMERFGRTGDFIRDRAKTPPVPLVPLDPAWDPHSKTPPLPSTSSSHQVSYEHHGHWATDRQLLGRELCVKVNGKMKTLLFRQGRNSSPVECYICKGKKKIEAVLPESVEPMHPATPRNYERWIVIKGWHTGKYVRSIRYEKEATPKMPIQWTVAMVVPVEGKVDEQTGEELQLESTDLCLEDKTEASKDINMLFSQKLREEAPYIEIDIRPDFAKSVDVGENTFGRDSYVHCQHFLTLFPLSLVPPSRYLPPVPMWYSRYNRLLSAFLPDFLPIWFICTTVLSITQDAFTQNLGMFTKVSMFYQVTTLSRHAGNFKVNHKVAEGILAHLHGHNLLRQDIAKDNDKDDEALGVY
ncbi:hypothetical protein EDD85DRAFT_936560 [Armillaria nabsnona]|nr:hypothetical protein EDD85DRAFT_936560 [Armillaria nabsnona]